MKDFGVTCASSARDPNRKKKARVDVEPRDIAVPASQRADAMVPSAIAGLNPKADDLRAMGLR